MTTAFTPPVNPSYDSSRKTTLKVNKLQYGDGYSQRTPDGINFKGRTLSATWTNISVADADTIEGFFEDQEGASFTWDYLRETGTNYKYIALEWDRKASLHSGDTLTVSMERVFDN